jgi:hypothetical protein
MARTSAVVTGSLSKSHPATSPKRGVQNVYAWRSEAG